MKSLLRNYFGTAALTGLLWWTGLASAQETERQYLSGRDKDDAVPWKFFCSAGKQSGFWTNIVVPSNWEMHGFCTLNYYKDATNVPVERGSYEHEFIVPKHWSNRRIFLVFEGSMTDTSAQINGQSAGPLHQGGFYRFKYDVTPLIKFDGTNKLEVNVNKLSADNSVNRAERQGDYWIFGGIFRPVYLEAMPAHFIDRVAIDARADGAFAMDVFAPAAQDDERVEAQITDLSGKTVGLPFSQKLSSGTANLAAKITSPRQWTAEAPNLYFVDVRLMRGKEILHTIRQRFGFRTMEVRTGDGPYVNGRRVILQGCDRHSFWPDSGRCLNETIHRLDIGLLKEMNMNAVRMTHYPPDQQFLDLCDELGLYVLDELGGWQKKYDTGIGTKLVEEFVTHDVNHPSIVFWDNGNEGGWNIALDHLYAQWDPQHRAVLHPWAVSGGVNAAHYRKYADVERICASNTIYMPTEFLHGLYDGGAGAGLEDYWNLMRRSPIVGGGFIWAFLDEGLKRSDTGKIDVVGDQAPDGILGPYRQKEASFFTIKELWSPIVIDERVLPDNFDGTLTVENRYSFTSASKCKFQWQLRKFPRANQTAGGFRITASNTAASPVIAPGTAGKLQLKLPKNWRDADALAVSAVGPDGRELWTWTWPLSGADKFRDALATSSAAAPSVSETADELLVKAGDLTVRFNQQRGELAGVQRGAQTFSLANGPRLAGSTSTLTNFQHAVYGGDQLVTAKFDGDLKTVQWRIHGNGWVECAYTFNAQGPKEFIGVVFDYPDGLVKHKRWLGNGPYRVWKDRLCGVTFNVWENDYNDTITGWSEWNYPEFKGCFADVRWMQLTTSEGLITAVPGNDSIYVQVLTPSLVPAKFQHKAIAPLPTAGLAFLNAIPAMGDKFIAAVDDGPQGQKNIATGEYFGKVSFYFGKVP